MALRRPVFVWSDFGDSLFLAIRLQEEGARVTFYTKKPDAKWVGRGLVNTVSEPKVPEHALVIFDAVGYGAQGAALRKAGHPVIGGNAFDHDLEVDRTAGADIMARAGILIPETHHFDNVKDAIEFLEDEDGKFYMKVSGEQVTESDRKSVV